MTPAGRSVERETKLAVGAGYTLPDLSGVVGGTVALPEQRTLTRYFDTSDHRLWNRAVTLRHRSGEGPGPGTWTLKLPEGDSDGDGAATLDRTELTWPGPSDAVPTDAARIVRGLVRHGTLAMVAELHSVRRRLTLQDAAGTAWGELDDDTVTVVDTQPPRFRQIEVELVGDHDGQLGDVVQALRRAGAEPDPEPKLAKAFRVAGRIRGVPLPEPVSLDRKSTVGDLVTVSLRRGVDQLLEHDVRLRADGAEPAPNDVHQARVATRRLRSDLKVVGGYVDPVWLAHTRDELRWLGGVLGAVRDADVLSGTLTADTSGTMALRSSLGAERRAAARQLASTLESERYLALLDRLVAASEHPPLIPAEPVGGGDRTLGARAGGPAAGTVLPRLIEGRLRALRRSVASAGRHPSDTQLHRIRIRAKQLRYTAESAVPVLGKPARRMAAAAEDLQTVLGEHHDSVAAEHWLRRQVAGTTPDAAFAAGVLVAREHRRQRRLRHRWRPVWARLDRRELHRFLG